MRALFNFLIPGCALFAASLYLIHSSHSAAIKPLHLDIGAAIVSLICALLAWRFDRLRLMYILQVLLLCDVAQRVVDAGRLPHPVTALMLGNLLLVGLLRERGIHSLRGALLSALPALQAITLYLLAERRAPLPIDWLSQPFLNLPFAIPGFSDTLLLLATSALLLQCIRFLRYPNPLEGALFWAMLGALVAVGQEPGLPATSLRATAGLTLLISFVETFHNLAYRDELTGIPGRRAMIEAFAKLGSRYSIAMVDIDFFKKLNDRYGHDIGDEVLKMVAARLAKCGGGGRAYRYGGEEFCLLFPGKAAETCVEHLEQLRLAIAEEPFTIRRLGRELSKPKNKSNRAKTGQNSVTVTVSIGVAERSVLHAEPQAVMKQADQALYKAKKGGRNKVCAASSS